jgi:hypothetical protein
MPALKMFANSRVGALPSKRPCCSTMLFNQRRVTKHPNSQCRRSVKDSNFWLVLVGTHATYMRQSPAPSPHQEKVESHPISASPPDHIHTPIPCQPIHTTPMTTPPQPTRVSLFSYFKYQNIWTFIHTMDVKSNSLLFSSSSAPSSKIWLLYPWLTFAFFYTFLGAFWLLKA